MSEPSNVGRRYFMKSGLAVAAGTASLRCAEANATEPAEATQRSDGIPTRAFGSTGRTLPILGMGGSAMVNSSGACLRREAGQCRRSCCDGSLRFRSRDSILRYRPRL